MYKRQVGDGANDLEMLSTASLGIVFNGNEFLKKKIPSSISIPKIDLILYFLGKTNFELNSI